MSYPLCGTLTYSSTTSVSVSFDSVLKEYTIYSVDRNIAFTTETITLTGTLPSGAS